MNMSNSTSNIPLNSSESQQSVVVDARYDPTQSRSNDNDDNGQSMSMEEEEEGITINEILYSVSSFHAIARPVTLTMVLAALSVVYINTEETIAQGEQQMSNTYNVFQSDEGEDSIGDNLLKSVGNSLVIVGVICLMTFGIVLLYKFRCMKILIGYMIFSSATLLGVLGGLMLDVAIEKYRIPIDKVSTYFILYNFAFVGTIAIFYQHGVPSWVTQAYLVATSVILAWQFSHFDAWTTWTLLVFLALYDLCAVLTPCGPLKALVGLMQQEDSPTMPGLLYEAPLPSGVSRPNNSQNMSTRRGHENDIEPPSASSTDLPSAISMADGEIEIHNEGIVAFPEATPPTPRRTARIPLALACLYRLSVLSPLPSSVRSQNSSSPNVREPLLDTSVPTTSLTASSPSFEGSRVSRDNFSPEELCQEVEVLFPSSGYKTIQKSPMSYRDGAPRYFVIDRRTGRDVILKSLIVNPRGRVYEEVESDEDDDEEPEMSSSIKLGLGDFIFYSVLVAKAAMYSFATFAACMLVILFGLGATLVLLSVYHKALPALPISIFLGVTFYLLTRTVIEPWIEDLLRKPYYI